MQPFNYQIDENSFDAPQYLYSSAASEGELIKFPDVDPSWYDSGLPDEIVPPQQVFEGNLLEVFPIKLVSKKSTKHVVEVDPKYGYFLYNGQITNKIGPTHFNDNEIICAQMTYVDVTPERFAGSKVTSKGYWKLLQDFGGIDAGSTASQQVSLTSGLSETNSQSFSYSIGFNAGIKGTIEIVELSAQLSLSLTQTFGRSVTISSQQTVSTTVDYKAQPKNQRIGVYQFYRSYDIDVSDQTRNNLAQLGGPSVRLEEATKPSGYATNHFQKVFVLDPN